MSLSQRKVTIAAVGTTKGMRAYTTSGDGQIREACSDMETSMIARASAQGGRTMVQQCNGWYPGPTVGTCDKYSTLCVYALEGNRRQKWKVFLFYQTTEKSIREVCFDKGSWTDTGFIQPDCMVGTEMAVVHSSDGNRVMLVFQDRDGFLCYRRYRDSHWESAQRLCKAAEFTGIAATTWDDTDNIRIYYQDEQNALQEYHGTFDGSWTTGAYIYKPSRPLGSLGTISYLNGSQPEVRIYFQIGTAIAEYRNDSPTSDGSWYRSDFSNMALPNADIAVFSRNIQTGLLINLLWAGPDQVLNIKVMGPNMGWLSHVPCGMLPGSSGFCGMYEGDAFSDLDHDCDTKTIKKVLIRSGGQWDAYSLEFTDGSSTPWRGGQGGDLREFVLDDGEDITGMLVSHNDQEVQRVKFVTSNGRQSDWYGEHGGSPVVLNGESHALAGFSGSALWFMTGFMPIWSQRTNGVGAATLHSLAAEADEINKNIGISQGLSRGFESSSAEIQNELSGGMKAPAELAVEGVNTLIASLTELARAEGDAEMTRALVAKCKGQGAIVGSRFDALHKQASGLMGRTNRLVVDITHEASLVDTRLRRLAYMVKTAAVMRCQADVQKLLKGYQLDEARVSISSAQQIREEARSNHESALNARIARDIFTLGFGEIGDWGGLNHAMEYAENLIRTTEDHLRACENSLQSSQNELNEIDADITRFGGVKSTLESYGPALRGQLATTTQLLKKNMDLVNASLDMSVFLATLAAKSETLTIHYTAHQFAKSILAIANLMGTTKLVTSSLTDQQGSIQKSLELISSTEVEPEDLEGMV